MNLPKTYIPAKYESDIYKLWEDSGYFSPSKDGEPFSIVLPPPNATGVLHVGHAAMLAIEDTIIRHQRMLGKSVVWVPGTDHAAIATNAILERELAKKGKTKHDLGREDFLKQLHKMVEDNKDSIRSQIRAMGASVDWTRERYTMEPAMNRIVGEVFLKMYEDGLIYRGHRIVNWDSTLQTVVSDDEIDYVEAQTKLYTLKYGPFEIATARPETKFGDKYVVMHPDDKRYSKYKHGQQIDVDWINGKIKATIIKDEAVQPEFGTGVMTITPWHDVVDFEIAERHNLDKEQIIDFDGKLLDVAEKFSGYHIRDARPKIVQMLKKKGLLVKEDSKYVNKVAISDRGKAVIEPQIMEQWFVDVNKPAMKWKGKKRSLKQVMQAVIKDGDIEILPKRFEKIYFAWVDNLRDWNISRQIWWGHRIPVWYKGEGAKKETHAGWEPPEKKGWKQDPDTLDTWFSSALWSWSTLIDAETALNADFSLEKMMSKAKDYKKFHPNSLMETGYDIIFFWVARMILATTYITGEVPFKTVYLHGLVRAKDGRKMSKSDPETIIDPMDVIPKYGTDALRLSMLVGQAPGNDMRIFDAKIAGFRNFCNKLWNIARFIESKTPKKYKPAPPKPSTLADHWIINSLHETTQRVDKHLQHYQLGQAYEQIYQFIWSDLADWYIELSKSELNIDVLNYVFENTLKITHPFAPYVTETIWETLDWQGKLLIGEKWPKIKTADKKRSEEFKEIQTIVREIRHLQGHLSTHNNTLYFKESQFLLDNKKILLKLTGLKDVRQVSSGKGLHLSNTREECWIDIEEQQAKNYIHKLVKSREDRKKVVEKLQARLDSKNYQKKAPKELVSQTMEQLRTEKRNLERLESEIETFEHALRQL